ncbi:MAG: hypothetical protein JXC85_06080 [Candidatus Aenigmarchaeota archaeon]|nr:hypothetical protein [Candidatus Aenigmarchaeota archaeon]
MGMEFYYSEKTAKKRCLSDDHLDTREFDFMQKFASDIDEIRTHGAEQTEKCLTVVNTSFHDSWGNVF